MKIYAENIKLKLGTLRPKKPKIIKFNLNNLKIFLIDESINCTGTHKDRMAYAISEYYIDILQQGTDSSYKPRFSIISSGSAAYSIQFFFNFLDFPPLHVLIDKEYEEEIEILNNNNCRVFPLNLSKRCLDSNEILRLSCNPCGIDLTSNMAMLPYHSFYQEIAQAIITLKPDYCFLPFGSGHLFGNLIYQCMKHFPEINLIGGYTCDSASIAKKLYAPFLPFNIINNNFINTLKLSKRIGRDTIIKEIKEPLLNKSMKILNDMNIMAEPSAAGGLAVALQHDPIILKDKKIIVISTGYSHYLKHKTDTGIKKKVIDEVLTY